MKRYIIFGLILTLAFPAVVMAQDEDDDYNTKPQKVLVRKQMDYDTKTVKGRVVNALTKAPVPGVIIRTSEIEGYSKVTGEDGTYEMKVPTFTSALSVEAPDYNFVVIGLQEGTEQRDILLYPTTFQADYTSTTNVRSDYSMQQNPYTNALNIKEEMQNQLGAQVYNISRSGTPGIGNVMFIQGINSFNVNCRFV